MIIDDAELHMQSSTPDNEGMNIDIFLTLLLKYVCVVAAVINLQV